MKYRLQIYFQKACSNSISIQRLLALIVALMLGLSAHFPLSAQRGSKITTVVIDPGHGGRDPGAIGRRAKEKDIVLEVALKTGAYIEKYLPDVNVIYTRTRDEFIELHRRATIANQNQADVFISIHCNATRSAGVHGSETFVMGDHRSQANLEVAQLENAAILLEDNAEEEYGGFDPNSPEAYIAFTLYQSENKNQSLRLAQKVQEQFTTRVGRRDRSVQQAGFLVLYRTTMPSILVELGFLTNPVEEEFLMSEQGKVYMASALFRAFRDYKVEFEQENAVPLQAHADQPLKPESISDKVLTADDKATARLVPSENARSTESQPTESANLPGLVYQVQIATSPRNIPTTDKRFAKAHQPTVYFHNGVYKYTSGNFIHLADAIQHQSYMRKQGFKDAFVIAFFNGERISIDKARSLENP